MFRYSMYAHRAPEILEIFNVYQDSGFHFPMGLFFVRELFTYKAKQMKIIFQPDRIKIWHSFKFTFLGQVYTTISVC